MNSRGSWTRRLPSGLQIQGKSPRRLKLTRVDAVRVLLLRNCYTNASRISPMPIVATFHTRERTKGTAAA